MILGRFAVDKAWQGRQIGAALLQDAALRSLQAARSIGIRAMLVHAISEDAKRLYEKCGFVVAPTDPMMLMATMADLAASFDAVGGG